MTSVIRKIPKFPEVFTAYGFFKDKIYSQCGRCLKIVQINKFIIGSLHCCD